MDCFANDEFEVKRYYSDDDEEDEEEPPGDLEEEPVIEVKENTKKKKKKNKKKKTDKVDTNAVEDNVENEANQNHEQSGKSSEPSSFTMLGEVAGAKRQRVRRQLPAWLANPDIVSIDYSEDQLEIDALEGLEDKLVKQLRKEGIEKFFPVQRQVIPYLIQRNDFRPNDVCVSAPTGSGKTLAFVLPIVHSLMSRVVPRVRALVVLPVQDLASQVARVFTAYSCGLQVRLLSAQRPFAQEQSELVRRKLVPSERDAFHSMADIIVATPGRLVDHLERTEGFSLQYLRYLVIDEADRVMDEVQNDWLQRVERAVFKGWRSRPRPMCVQTEMEDKWMPPLQKLLFSATLSKNPEQLERLNLFEPKLFSCSVKPKTEKKDIVDANNNDGGEEDKFITPVELEQKFVVCENEELKPKLLLHMLKTNGHSRALVFTKSISHTHVLSLLLSSNGLSVGELSSKVSSKRQRVLRRFEQNEINVLVCSDALARGIDVEDVDVVYSYDCPQFPRTYIHRVGRTARAGKEGTAITFVTQKERKKFALLVKKAHQEGFVKEIKVNDIVVDEDAFERAQVKVKEAIEKERMKVASKRGIGRNKGEERKTKNKKRKMIK